MTIVKSLFDLLSPRGRGARLSVFIFHRVLPVQDDLFPEEMHASRFESVCSWISSWFNVLPLDVAAAKLASGELPARAACITFDDGYADNFTVALPILQRHGLKATFFVSTGFLNGGRMWNDTIIESLRNCVAFELDLSTIGMGTLSLQTQSDRRRAINHLVGQLKYQPLDERLTMVQRIAAVADVDLPCNLMMTSDQVRAMRSAGMQIGAHTVSHPILARLGTDQCKEEIASSKVALENLLGERVSLFAYPNGKFGEDYLPETVRLVKQLGFDAAVSTEWGASRQGDDLFQIKRFTPWDLSKGRFGLRLAQNLFQS